MITTCDCGYRAPTDSDEYACTMSARKKWDEMFAAPVELSRSRRDPA
jgi:hypothetical protein